MPDRARPTSVLNAAKITLTAPASAAEWDEAVLRLPGCIPFHGWDFLTVCAEAWGVDFEPLVARVDDRVVGGVPRLVQHRVGLHWVNHLNLLNFMGPEVEPEHVGAVLEVLGRRDRARTMREREEVRLRPEIAPTVDGWKRRTGISMVVPLAGRTREEVIAQGGRNFRKEAPRLARKFGTVIEESTEEDLRVALPALMHEVFHRQGMSVPYADDSYWRVYEALSKRGAVKAFTARIDGEVASVAITLLSATSNIAYEWVAADDSRFRAAEASMAVQRELILWAHEAGYAGYELLGGTTEGIAAFKRSMGARDNEYCIYERGHRV